MRATSRLCLKAKPAHSRSQLSTKIVSTHIDRRNGLPTMVDVQPKAPTARVAVACSSVLCPPIMGFMFPANSKRSKRKASRCRDSRKMQHITELSTEKKGSVFATAIVAGTLGVKATSTLIPFCHPIAVERCKFRIDVLERWYRNVLWHDIRCYCEVGTTNKTGVEMEAMVGASVAALTIYDMLKGVRNAQAHGLRIGVTRLLKKSGGKSDIALVASTASKTYASGSSSSSSDDPAPTQQQRKKAKRYRKKRSMKRT